jgi:hypothetical protein
MLRRVLARRDGVLGMVGDVPLPAEVPMMAKLTEPCLLKVSIKKEVGDDEEHTACWSPC